MFSIFESCYRLSQYALIEQQQKQLLEGESRVFWSILRIVRLGLITVLLMPGITPEDTGYLTAADASCVRKAIEKGIEKDLLLKM